MNNKMRKIKIKKNEFKIGMRVKVPIAGWWIGKPNKYQVWFKGIIHYINKKDGEILSIEINVKPSSYIGKMLFLKSDLNDIFKCK